MTLAEAIMRAYGHQQYFNTFARRHRRLRVLEINDAGQLGQFLTAMPHRVLVHYPDVDMTKLPLEEASFDMVIHSDTRSTCPTRSPDFGRPVVFCAGMASPVSRCRWSSVG